MGQLTGAQLPKPSLAARAPGPRPPAPTKFDPQKMATALSNPNIAGRGTPSSNTFMPIRADAKASYTNPYASANWQAPAAGAVGPGGAVWGGGGGGENRYDHQQQGAGLWSVGIDRNSPTAINDAISWYQRQDPGTRAELGAMGGAKMNNPTQMLDVIDQRQRDVSRRIKIENNFFTSPFGKILGAGLTMAGGALGGPLGGALAGGITGGLATKSPLGGLLGAVGGGLGAMTPGPSLKSFINSPVSAAKGAIAGKLTPQGLGSTAAGFAGGRTK